MTRISQDNARRLFSTMLPDATVGWSIGAFGAIGEFVREADEPARIDLERLTVVTERGGLAVNPTQPLEGIAFDTLSKDGETWGCNLILCQPMPADPVPAVIRDLGPDDNALRYQDRGAHLFDLGVGLGAVRMAVRTRDAALLHALRAADGEALLGPASAAIMPLVLAAQPHRVMLSPVGRLEVYQPIPPADGKSPPGPHTHLLPKLLKHGRTHSANTPAPEGMQAMISVSPPSPWRDRMGERRVFDEAADADFDALLERFALRTDREIAARIRAALRADMRPEDFAWPDDRRSRQKARIELRRMARLDPSALGPWRARYDGLSDVDIVALEDMQD